MIFYFLFLLVFDFCRFCVVIRFFHPHHNGQWPPTSKDFYTRSYPSHYFLILILEKEPVFPFQCWVLNDGTSGTIFITSLVWRCPWLGIESGTSRTRCQHSTNRLSRRHQHINDDLLASSFSWTCSLIKWMLFSLFNCLRLHLVTDCIPIASIVHFYLSWLVLC